MDSEAKENVKSYHKYTRIAALLWLFHVGAIVTILYPVVIMQGETEPFKLLAFMAIFAVVLLIAAVGCFMKKSWGRKLGLFVSICLLLNYPKNINEYLH